MSFNGEHRGKYISRKAWVRKNILDLNDSLLRLPSQIVMTKISTLEQDIIPGVMLQI